MVDDQSSLHTKRERERERERERFLKIPISKTERNGLECSWIDGGFTVRKEGDP
jgi:hypothetical protein